MPVRKDIKPYSQSVNIIRDADRVMSYYPTDNTRRIYSQIINDYAIGNRVFNIIGSYGTGKSSFLWAMEQNLVHNKPYFAPSKFEGKKLSVLKLIGEYKPIKEAFAYSLNCDQEATSQDIFAKIFYDYKDAVKNGLLLILIDEFGKFLEYASKHNPEAELYFLQELAEFAANPKYNILLVSTVHQNFDAYAFGLNHSQRTEWSKVKGRFKEVTFNEPVEQLLRLAAEHIKQSGFRTNADDDVLSMQIAELFKRAAAFDSSPELTSELALDVLPLELFAAHVLTLSLKKYGQNERSLFSFLESSDHTGLSKVSRENPLFNLAHVYEYLLFNFYAFIQSKYNPDYASWAAIRNALDEAQRRFDHQLEDCLKLIKSIGLFQLFAKNGSRLDEVFLKNYAKLCLQIENPGAVVEKLKTSKIIIFREHLNRYILNEGTSLDVEAALIQAASKVDQVNDVATLLKRYYALPPVLAKSYSYNTGTPRVFEFVITDRLRVDKAVDDVDGHIYLLFNESLKLDEVIAYSKKIPADPSIYVFYENSKSIKEVLFELEKLRKVKEENSDDRIAVKLLDESIQAAQKALNYFILDSLNSGAPHLKWVWNGKNQLIHNKRSFNELLSEACKTAYPDTPVFNNELLNKHKISPSIATARKNYFRALVQYWNQTDIGFDKEKFPPEKMIYLSLLKQNGISVARGSIAIENDAYNILPLWNLSMNFLESARERRKSISSLVELFSSAPFKLKQGLISFWLPSFLFIKRDEFALFGENGYVPYLTEETLDLIIRYPEKYELKSFDLDGIRLELFNRYRTFLQQGEARGLDNETFIDTIRPFLTFYRKLPDFVKQTKVNLSREAIALRGVIANTEDLEKTFFDDFPAALGYSSAKLLAEPLMVEAYIHRLEETIKEIRTCFELLVNRFEEFIQDRAFGVIGTFPEYKDKLILRYKKLKPVLIKAEQKTFLQRLSSNIEDRKAWLNSIAQILTGKTLENFDDRDEFLLKDKFNVMLAELDSLNELTHEDIDSELEDVVGFEINNFIDGINKTVVRMPKNKRQDVARVEAQISELVMKTNGNNQVNILALANVIKKLMNQ